MEFSFQVHMLEDVNAYSPWVETWVLVSNLLLTKPVTLGKSLLSWSPFSLCQNEITVIFKGSFPGLISGPRQKIGEKYSKFFVGKTLKKKKTTCKIKLQYSHPWSSEILLKKKKIRNEILFYF